MIVVPQVDHIDHDLSHLLVGLLALLDEDSIV